jgi:hypothetical protein
MDLTRKNTAGLDPQCIKWQKKLYPSWSWQVKKTAGTKWCYSFMNKRPGVSLMQPQSTSLGRDRVFDTSTSIFQYFRAASKPEHIWYHRNLQRIWDRQEKTRKVMTQKYKHIVGSLSREERGTADKSSASGRYVTPKITKTWMRKWYKRQCPSGIIFAFHSEKTYTVKRSVTYFRGVWLYTWYGLDELDLSTSCIHRTLQSLTHTDSCPQSITVSTSRLLATTSTEGSSSAFSTQVLLSQPPM